ncbi:MAG TPA: hypothetical protein VE593_00820, partial [Nitrososphaeraceae archaeon]|nr:hypothetical protein [Nitrososphaeraceae archaeon]
ENDNSNTSLTFTSPQTASQLPAAPGPAAALAETTGPPVSGALSYNSARQQQQIDPQNDMNQSALPSSNSSPILTSSIPSLTDSRNHPPVQPQSFPPAALTSLQSQASLYPNNNGDSNSNYSNNSNTNNQGNIASNSTPQSTIKVTSTDQPVEHISQATSSPTSNSTKQPNLNDERKQLQQRIQEILGEFNSVNRNDGASLPTYIERY